MYYFLSKITYIVVYILVHIFSVPIIFSGIGNLKNLKGPVIIASNHESRLDPIFIAYFISFINRKNIDIRFYAWHVYYDMPVLGWYIKAMKSLRLINKQGLNILDEGVDLLKKKHIIGIFPEGKIKKVTEKDKRGKRGISYLAWKSKSDIIPIYLNYKRRWANIPIFYQMEFVVGKKFRIYDIIKSESDLQKGSDIVIQKIYELKPNKNNIEKI